MRLCALLGAAAALQRAPRPLPRTPRLHAQPSTQDVPAAARIAVLLSVPVAWGTYAPAVKAVYALPQPPPGVVFSLAYYVVALACLSVVATTRRDCGPLPYKAGAELGLYLFLGNLFQVVGLETVSADAAAFLVQTTTIIVPVLEAQVLGAAVSSSTYRNCAVAMAGVAVLCGESLESGAAPPQGILLILCAALLYSVHVVRLSAIAPDCGALDLAQAKASAEVGFAVASVAALYAFTPFAAGRAFVASLPGDSPETLGALATAVIWCGAVTCAYTIWAQSFGQRGVQAARANLIYTSQPITTALFAFLLLHEVPSPGTLAGGGLILVAVAAEVVGMEEAPA
jgi:drug/metabolite transporter (DMT)-like permease